MRRPRGRQGRLPGRAALPDQAEPGSEEEHDDRREEPRKDNPQAAENGKQDFAWATKSGPAAEAQKDHPPDLRPRERDGHA